MNILLKNLQTNIEHKELLENINIVNNQNNNLLYCKFFKKIILKISYSKIFLLGVLQHFVIFNTSIVSILLYNLNLINKNLYNKIIIITDIFIISTFIIYLLSFINLYISYKTNTNFE